MREIKFRCWCVTARYWDNQMLETRSIKLITECNTHILHQYTGLNDKNGKEIYEGDIVSIGELYPNCEVFYDESLASFKHRIYGAGILEGQVLTISNFKKRILKRFEVIGNIFENPELLK